MNDDIPEDFHPYVRLLITRMRSHPEEFNPFVMMPQPKAERFMTEAERMFLWNEERKVALDIKHQELMRRIVEAGEPKPDPMTIPASPYQYQTYPDANYQNHLYNAMQANTLERLYHHDAHRHVPET